MPTRTSTSFENWTISTDIREEILRVTASLPPGKSALATGSLAEGLGNVNSDVDLYIVSDEGVVKQELSFALRRTHYVDCEYFTLESLDALADRVEAHSWQNVQALTVPEIDRYYRTAIAVPVVVTAAAGQVIARFRTEPACAALVRAATHQAYSHLSRAACLLAYGARHEAALLLREGAMWRGTAALAAAGEGYPALKWTGEKAARLHGRHSPEFHEIVDGFIRPSPDLDANVHRLRDRVSPPEELIASLDGRAYRLHRKVQLLESGSDHRFLRAGRSLCRVEGLVAAVCRKLAAGEEWDGATERIAGDIGVPVPEVRLAARYYMADLEAQGFVAVTEEGR